MQISQGQHLAAKMVRKALNEDLAYIISEIKEIFMKADQTKEKDIILASSFHIAEDEIYEEEDRVYRISFRVNDAFKEAKSHSERVQGNTQ